MEKLICPFLTKCGAVIIRDYLRKTTNAINWQEKFCWLHFKDCPHYEIRKK